MWDIRIRVEDGVCDSNPVQFYERIDDEEPEPHGRVEVVGDTVWMWLGPLRGLSEREFMVSFNVEYEPPVLNGWTDGHRRTRMIPVSASRFVGGRRYVTKDKEQVLCAFMGKYCILDEQQDGRLIGPPGQMTMHGNADSMPDQVPPGTIYDEPPDDEESPYRSPSDDGLSQEYIDYLHNVHHGGGFSEADVLDLLSDDYNVRSFDGDGDRAAG